MLSSRGSCALKEVRTSAFTPLSILSPVAVGCGSRLRGTRGVGSFSSASVIRYKKLVGEGRVRRRAQLAACWQCLWLLHGLLAAAAGCWVGVGAHVGARAGWLSISISNSKLPTAKGQRQSFLYRLRALYNYTTTGGRWPMPIGED